LNVEREKLLVRTEEENTSLGDPKSTSPRPSKYDRASDFVQGRMVEVAPLRGWDATAFRRRPDFAAFVATEYARGFGAR